MLEGRPPVPSVAEIEAAEALFAAEDPGMHALVTTFYDREYLVWLLLQHGYLEGRADDLQPGNDGGCS